jgi:hypothetical protein
MDRMPAVLCTLPLPDPFAERMSDTAHGHHGVHPPDDLDGSVQIYDTLPAGNSLAVLAGDLPVHCVNPEVAEVPR